ncbi:MAG: FAD-binding protein [Deltaproteobacteria bacterium]|nr:FAD-binding protein [Deltaproteobacteria bacterium]MBW2139236.1 FAD-binding protein [Deltaproteobacteria bacterium]
MAEVDVIRAETDVLVIGGGIAGIFAAVSAARRGARILIVDKGRVGLSGMSIWADTFCVFDEREGHDAEQWHRAVAMNGDYVNNRDYLDMLIEDSAARWRDLNDWGAIGTDKFGYALRKQVKAHKIQKIDRTMLTDLLVEGGQAVGAIGFSIDRPECICVNAKAVVMCSGAGGYRPHGFPISNMTFDGDAMAYRAGLAIRGKEFSDTHLTNAAHPGYSWGIGDIKWGPGIVKTGPPPMPTRRVKKGLSLAPYFLAHEGKAPIVMSPPMGGPQGPYPGFKYRGEHPGPQEMVGGAATGMAVHKAEGIVPADSMCRTHMPGLFAAGDALSSMLCGARYSGIGFSFAGSAVQGFRAGEVAADFALEAPPCRVSQRRIKGRARDIFSPLGRTKGFTPRWVTQMLQAAMFPYYILYVKRGDRLKGSLANIEFLRDHCVPKMVAKDLHELRLVHETGNMVLNAEMKLRASLFRKESRGMHYREDYPARDDKRFLAWVHVFKGQDGSMKLKKVPVPRKWRPPAKLSYEERYVHRFPGEMEFLEKRRREQGG